MKTLSKAEIEEIREKCLKLVKRKPAEFFQFKKLRMYEGLCVWSELQVDYRKEVLSTTIHECVHYLYPDYSESMVKYIESRIMNVCDSLDLAYFLKLVSNKFYKSELQKQGLPPKKISTYKKK